MQRFVAVLVALGVLASALVVVHADTEVVPDDLPMVEETGQPVGQDKEVNIDVKEDVSIVAPVEPDSSADSPSGDTAGGEEGTKTDGSEEPPESAQQITIQAENVVIQSEAEDPILYASASPFLQGGYFMDVATNLGSVTIYVPVNYAKGSFSYDSRGVPVNITASTISGYFVRNGSLYSVRFASMGGITYRHSDGSGYSWSDLSVTSVDDTNIQILTENPPLYGFSELFPYILTFCLGVVVLCLFMKRF